MKTSRSIASFLTSVCIVFLFFLPPWRRRLKLLEVLSIHPRLKRGKTDPLRLDSDQKTDSESANWRGSTMKREERVQAKLKCANKVQWGSENWKRLRASLHHPAAKSRLWSAHTSEPLTQLDTLTRCAALNHTQVVRCFISMNDHIISNVLAWRRLDGSVTRM